MTLTDVETDEPEKEFIRLVASVEAASGHPIGKAVALGADQGLIIPERWADRLAALENEGKTAFLAGWDGEARGVIAVADTIRLESRVAVENLSRNGIATGMVTGDNARTAEHIASQIGVGDVRAEVLRQTRSARTSSLDGRLHSLGTASTTPLL